MLTPGPVHRPSPSGWLSWSDLRRCFRTAGITSGLLGSLGLFFTLMAAHAGEVFPSALAATLAATFGTFVADLLARMKAGVDLAEGRLPDVTYRDTGVLPDDRPSEV